MKRKPKNTAAWVRKLRGSKTQVQFANQLGVSFVTINRWETGKHEPQSIAMNRLTRYADRQAGKAKR